MERAFKRSAAMSQGTGTGHPLTFRCSKCKVCRGDDSKRGTNWFATGRVRGGAIPAQLLSRVSSRHKAEYQCRACGHVGWSGHHTVLEDAREYLARGKAKP